jgi:hypothetical protein
MKKWFIIMLLAGSVIAVGAATAFAMRAVRADRDVAVAEANLAAMQDTIQRYRADSTQTATLMQRQEEVNDDSIRVLLSSLGEAIDGRDQTLRALNTLRVEFDVLRREYTSVAVRPIEPEEGEVGTGDEEATFDIAGPPIEGSLRVVRRVDLPWSLYTDLTPSPFSQTYSVGCDELRRAIVNVTTPSWVNTTLERGVVDPDVCNPIAPTPVFAFSTGKAIWAGGGVVIGALIAKLLINTTTTVVQTGEPYDPHWQY